MRHTPSALKWLVEKRARVAHDLEQTSRLAMEFARRVGDLQLDLAALDRAVTIYDPKLDAACIQPVDGRQGRYGKRGTLREAIETMLQELAPEWVATDNLEALVTGRLGISFASAAERKRWYDNTFARQLRNLVGEGRVERFHDASVVTTEVGRWRWTVETSKGLSEL
jgi:hypothetical protein